MDGLLDVRFEICHHCTEQIGMGRFYVAIPDEQPDARSFFHAECLETEAAVEPVVALPPDVSCWNSLTARLHRVACRLELSADLTWIRVMRRDLPVLRVTM